MKHRMKRIDQVHDSILRTYMKSGIRMKVNGQDTPFAVQRSNPIWRTYWQGQPYPWRRAGRVLGNRYVVQTQSAPPLGSIVIMEQVVSF